MTVKLLAAETEYGRVFRVFKVGGAEMSTISAIKAIREHVSETYKITAGLGHTKTFVESFSVGQSKEITHDVAASIDQSIPWIR